MIGLGSDKNLHRPKKIYTNIFVAFVTNIRYEYASDIQYTYGAFYTPYVWLYDINLVCDIFILCFFIHLVKNIHLVFLQTSGVQYTCVATYTPCV